MSGDTAFLGLALLSAVALSAAALSYTALRCSTRIVERDRPESVPHWLRWIPLIGTLVVRIANESNARRQSETDSQTRYKILTENVAAAVLLHQSDGTILWGSPFTEVLTGFSLSEIYADRAGFLLGHVHEDDKRLVEKSLSIVKTGEPFQYRYRFYHKSGMPLWLETRTVPIFDNSVNDYIALSITLDVTANVMNQLQIEERNRDLNEFTYMVSHDLKNPINTIKGMIDLIREDPLLASNRTLYQAAHYIATAAGRLENLTDGVLELARVSASERTLELVDLNRVLHEVREDFKHQLEGASGTITTVEELPLVLGNQTQLYQVFSNLIGNAIKYRAPERPLIISVAPEKTPSRRRASVVVSDNGRGIAPQYLDDIFKPFNRAGESSIQGTGVGLACVHRMVDRLGGSIHVDSTEGKGSSFTVTLRRSPGS